LNKIVKLLFVLFILLSLFLCGCGNDKINKNLVKKIDIRYVRIVNKEFFPVSGEILIDKEIYVDYELIPGEIKNIKINYLDGEDHYLEFRNFNESMVNGFYFKDNFLIEYDNNCISYFEF
jgi:hypothetical protein